MKIVSDSTDRIAIVFNKHDLIAMKEGKALQTELVTGNGKLKVTLIRDRAFQQIERQFMASVKKAALNAAVEQANTPDHEGQEPSSEKPETPL